mmetsp:Transcript_10883/g.16147  ORF Transcript_10883/g.16147 Transcript_10883/m.16147 type:complete len:98 (-) Transcript_10883:25-318(-)
MRRHRRKFEELSMINDRNGWDCLPRIHHPRQAAGRYLLCRQVWSILMERLLIRQLFASNDVWRHCKPFLFNKRALELEAPEQPIRFKFSNKKWSSRF